MYDPVTGRQVDHVPSTNGDISDPDKRFKRGFGVFAVIVLMAIFAVTRGNMVAVIVAVFALGGMLIGIVVLSVYDDRRELRRQYER